MALVLSGCSLTDKLTQKAGEKIGEKIIESATNSEIDIDNNQTTINTNEGSTQWGEDVQLPETFPEDIPIYEGAKIESTSTSETDNSYYASLVTTDNFSDIKDFYKTELESNGWTIDDESTYAGEAGQSAMFYNSKDNRDLSVGIYENFSGVEGETTITLTCTETASE